MFTRSRKDSSLARLEGLEIVLHKDILTMYGSSDESVGCILRGALKFQILEPMKVKSISLSFNGKVKILTPAVTPLRELDLLEHKWTFLESEQDPYLLAPSNYEYNFELPLPGNLPESVEVPYGDISYNLLAIVERPGFKSDFKTEKKVDIQRAPLLFTDELLHPNVATGIWQQKVGYCVSIPDTNYTVGQTFPVHFNLLSLDPFLCITKVTAVMKEYVTCKFQGFRPMIKYHDVGRSSVLPNREQELVWDGSLNLEILKRALYDCETDYIQVSHKLFLDIEVMEPTGEIQTFRVQMKVGIQSSLQNELAQSPPRYQPFSSFTGLPPPPYNFDMNPDYSHILVI
ncbi:hypothetical protein K493DRAFT_335838 [Basidiobolus meristosporus CBS 931.73]|uniref:Uncharacterized protein n=1 Tax=Basidiobolus meristosporus CBS 931.73 TaxID=1314790 RepID=A0A1Y1YMN5_9FUNG|nr:hypothetical protein K493DRAFT_335838 [Basidiobolus meristosporus CBS 931.73]|eukprot:ORX99271.1 hypothetical protein K493DRAFT_335838 [Basidiobolus meristosporus CBS 931.73]